jgi:hypothetical protein
MYLCAPCQRTLFYEKGASNIPFPPYNAVANAPFGGQLVAVS